MDLARKPKFRVGCYGATTALTEVDERGLDVRIVKAVPSRNPRAVADLVEHGMENNCLPSNVSWRDNRWVACL